MPSLVFGCRQGLGDEVLIQPRTRVDGSCVAIDTTVNFRTVPSGARRLGATVVFRHVKPLGNMLHFDT